MDNLRLLHLSVETRGSIRLTPLAVQSGIRGQEEGLPVSMLTSGDISATQYTDDSDLVSSLSVDNVHFLNVSKQNSGHLLQIAPVMKGDYLPIFIYIINESSILTFLGGYSHLS